MIKAEGFVQSHHIPGILTSPKPSKRGLEVSTPEYELGLLQLHGYEHNGGPFPLSGEDVVQDGDHYVDLHLLRAERNPIKEIVESLRFLADFLRTNPHIKWITGTSWLGTVAKGKLVERYGFTVTDHEVEPFVAELSVAAALLLASNASRVNKSNPEESVRFVYASRKSFLASR